MLDYKDIITKHCALGMTGSAIAETLGVSKSGVNDFLRAFKACKDLKYPLPKGITNYGIAAVVYPRKPTTHVGRDVSYELPDYEAVSKDMSSRKNMTLKQAVIANRDWIAPELNKDYAEWAEHNHTVILPAKVKKPKYKSSVENAVGILEKGFFHDMEEMDYFSLEQFNRDLWKHLDKLNSAPFTKKPHSRRYYWDEERRELMPLPPVPYEYMERRTAKVSSDYHVRFDNAYYSVDRAYLHKEVLIRASAATVKIFSKEGAFICEWPRATAKSQWSTDPNHLPANYRELSEWNGTYFIRKAMTVGPNTEAVIKRILASRKLEVQTYRMCQGVLSFTRKYSKQALEETCAQALELGKVNYTFIKNTIPVVAEDLGVSGYNTRANEERNKGAFVMDAESMDIDRLLSRSQSLAQSKGKGGDK